MDNFRKIVNPAICKGWYGFREIDCDAFCKIEIKENGCLTITGVIGPTHYGNCRGGAGQCADSIRAGNPKEEDGWTREMLDKFCDIWDNWHLNDVRAYCQHQKSLGWDREALEPMTLYHYNLRKEAASEQKKAENAALDALRQGKPFFPTPDQVFYAGLKYFLNKYSPVDGELKDYYEPYKSYTGRSAEEEKSRGFVRFDEDERGILCKPCPVCGYKYGTSWIKEELPDEVVEFLKSLPDTKVQPAWV